MIVFVLITFMSSVNGSVIPHGKLKFTVINQNVVEGQICGDTLRLTVLAVLTVISEEKY
jgi:hypothetical protein